MTDQRRALVTGASSGIGAALSRRLARRGYEVWLAARRLPELEALAASIADDGGVAHPWVLDVSKPEATEASVAKLDADVNGLDLVVANAGVGGGQVPVARQKFGEVRSVFETNLLGSIATLLAVVPGMVSRGRGHLVGVSSLAAETPLPTAADYGASKAGFSFFLECAAADLIPRGVSVTIVHPGFVKSPLTDRNKFEMPFIVELDRAADIIDRAIQDKRRMCRFPLALTTASTAGRLMPRALRDYVVNKAKPDL